MLKKYKIKVIEHHTDIVHVEALSEDDAKDCAHMLSECEFEHLYDFEVLSVEDIEQPKEQD